MTSHRSFAMYFSPLDADGALGRMGKAMSHKPMVNDEGTSDRPIVPGKLPHKAKRTAADVEEGRGPSKQQPRTGKRNSKRCCTTSKLNVFEKRC